MNYFKTKLETTIKKLWPVRHKVKTNAPAIMRKKYTDEKAIRQAIDMQIKAKFQPERINWPPEPWHPTKMFEKRLKRIRDKYHPEYVGT